MESFGPGWEYIAGIFGALISTLMGWLYSGLLSRLDKLTQADQRVAESLTALQVEIARDYVRRSEFADVMRQVLAKLDRIEERLDRKEDRQ